MQSDTTKLNLKGKMTEDNYLAGLKWEDKVKNETASLPDPDINGGERTSKSFLDEIDVFDQNLKGIRKEKEHHNREMKRILGPGYRSPIEQYKKLKNETEWLKGL